MRRSLCFALGLLLSLLAQHTTGFPVSPARSLQVPALLGALDNNGDGDLASPNDSNLGRRSFLGASLLASLAAVASKRTLGGDGSSQKILLIQPKAEEWIGTSLPLLSLDDAYKFATQAIKSDESEIFPFAHWPDRILRRPASTVDIPTSSDSDNNNEELLQKLQAIAKILKRTADEKGAVGLAAQQCGIDVSLVYLQPNLFLLNPRIIHRSQETDMQVWTEECLVLPPWFRATVMRDASVEIEYESLHGNDGKLNTRRIQLRGELARAAQHEMQHDQGILLLDHVELDQLPSIMQNVERSGHDQRMEQAFSRYVTEPTRRS